MRRLLVAVLATALLLAGCAGSGPTPKVKVTGDVGQEPKLTYSKPLAITDVSSQVIWKGSGPKLVDGGPVLLDFRLEKARNASLVVACHALRIEVVEGGAVMLAFPEDGQPGQAGLKSLQADLLE